MRGGERSDSQTQLRAIAGGATAPRPLAPARTPVLSLERERELVARCQAGEREAQDELYRTHRRLVAGNLYRVLGSPSELEDLVQEVFVIAFRGIARFRGESRLTTWLYRIAVNGALNRLRDGKAQRKAPLEDALPEVEREAAEREREPRALTALVGAEAGAKLRAAVARLPEKQRLVLELRVYQDLPFKDVAVIAECSENSAKVNFHHAVKKLRQLLSNEVEHE